jgi:hypothetical protein
MTCQIHCIKERKKWVRARVRVKVKVRERGF